MSNTKKALMSLALALVPLLLAACAEAPATATAETGVVRAQFNDAGEALTPDGWRTWVYVGTPLTPNALNGGAAPFPEFHNVYIEPSALAVYQETGRFPDGTQIAKELVSVISENANEDGSTTQVSGRGYFQGEFIGLELTVKDSVRFRDEPGNWAYFSFGHHAEPYAASAPALPAEACNACHAASAEDDWVFTQFYPVLRAAEGGGGRQGAAGGG